ncbi:MAG TPA: NUDIX domain-containing protein [Thermoplasmata archaeon]|nr:NUDIX domain-containing protein [Thermoplasmata archaeon]
MDEPDGPVARECVEGYLFSDPPFRLLLLRRPPARGRVWVPVSGKVEPEDPDFEKALRRELEEETGLTSPRRIVPLDWHVRFPADNGEVWRLHAYGVEIDRSFRPRLSPEHEAAEWVDAEEAVRRLHYPDNRAAVRRLIERVERPGSPKV